MLNVGRFSVCSRDWPLRIHRDWQSPFIASGDREPTFQVKSRVSTDLKRARFFSEFSGKTRRNGGTLRENPWNYYGNRLNINQFPDQTLYLKKMVQIANIINPLQTRWVFGGGHGADTLLTQKTLLQIANRINPPHPMGRRRRPGPFKVTAKGRGCTLGRESTGKIGANRLQGSRFIHFEPIISG